MIDPMQQLSMDPSVDAQFRRILAGVSAGEPMRSANENSRANLEDAVGMLGGGETVRTVVQHAYDLGRADGAIAQIDETRKLLGTAA